MICFFCEDGSLATVKNRHAFEFYISHAAFLIWELYDRSSLHQTG